MGARDRLIRGGAEYQYASHLRWIAPLQIRQHIEAAHARHHQIENDHVEPAAHRGAIERFHAIRRFYSVEAGAFRHAAEQLPDRCVVVDDESKLRFHTPNDNDAT